MRLHLHRPLTYGSSLVLTGSLPSLGLWKPHHGLSCRWTPGHIWEVDLPPMPTPARFEFKFCVKLQSGGYEWESTPNHALVIPTNPAHSAAISVQWGASTELVVPTATSLAASPPPTPAGIPKQHPSTAITLAVAKVSQEKHPLLPLRFHIKKDLQRGCRLYVGGSVAILGAWNKMNAPRMEAVGGGSYELQVAIPVSIAEEKLLFEYKYFVRDAQGGRTWEAGPNRRAIVQKTSQNCLLLRDRWDSIRVEFSIYYPGKENQVMYITGDPPQIGAWYKPGPTKMHLGPIQQLETDVMGRKWTLTKWMPSDQKSFSYRYIFIDEKTKIELWEREPNRRAEIDGDKPPVNSVVICRDLNFVSEMLFDQVPPNMFIGPYPQTASDIDAMATGGVTGVFNVQTDEDFKHRGIQWDKLMRRYDEHKIKVVRYPIRDFDRDSLRSHLRGATHALDELLKEGKHVYIHCTAGMGRAPACAVAYLCWVKKMQLEQAVAHVKKHRKVAVPNVPVLEAALKERY